MVGYQATNIYRIWLLMKKTVISTRDVIFDENETFNGNIESLRDDIRDLDLESIEHALREYESNVSDPTRDSRYERGAFDEDVAGIE